MRFSVPAVFFTRFGKEEIIPAYDFDYDKNRTENFNAMAQMFIDQGLQVFVDSITADPEDFKKETKNA